jgi:uncharacterized repeat protein (TIGR02543 family)
MVTNNDPRAVGNIVVMDLAVGASIRVLISGSDCLSDGLYSDLVDEASTNVSSSPDYNSMSKFSPLANMTEWAVTVDAFEGAYGGPPMNNAIFTVGFGFFRQTYLLIIPTQTFDHTIDIECNSNSEYFGYSSIDGGDWSIQDTSGLFAQPLPWPVIGIQVGETLNVSFSGSDCLSNGYAWGGSSATVSTSPAWWEPDSFESITQGTTRVITGLSIGAGALVDEYNFYSFGGSSMTGMFGVYVVPPPSSAKTVSFDSNGGSGSMTSQSASSSTALSSNSFTKTGYNFDEWNTAADGSGTSYADGATFDFTSDLTLYAQWLSSAPTYDHTIVMECNSSSPNFGKMSVDGGPWGDTKTSTASDPSLPSSMPAVGLQVGETLQITVSGGNCGSTGLQAGQTPGTISVSPAYASCCGLIPAGSEYIVTAVKVGNAVLSSEDNLFTSYGVGSFEAGFYVFVIPTPGPTHSVAFDSNGGSGSMTSQSASSSTALSSNSFTKTGYNFDEWNTAADGSGTSYADGASYSFSSDVTLYAQWLAIPPSYFAVTFNANGGEGSMSSQSANGPTALNSVTFTRCGYEFEGWTTEADGSGSYYNDGDSYPFDADATMYAAWWADEAHGATVSYFANGGSGSMTSQCSTTATGLSSNSFTRAGYTFSGWNTAADGSGTSYSNGVSFTFGSDVSLYAQWTINTYTVTFNSNGGNGSMNSQTGSSSQDLDLNLFRKSGYRFVGWNTAADGSGTDYSNEASYSFTSSTTLYALWEFIVVDELPEIEPIPENTIQQVGQSICTLDGQDIGVTLTPEFDSKLITIEGDGFTMALAGLDSNGDQLELDGDGNLVLQNDRLAYVEGTGFLPNSDVKLYLFSTPTYLGIVHTDADGNFSGTVEIPQEIEAGIHTLQANGFSDDGVIRSLSLGVSVTDAVGGGKKKTGKAKIFFAIDSAHITKSAKKAIRKMIKQLGSKNLKVVRILGFATPSDSLLADRKLSIKRAKAVKAFLKSIGVKGKFNVLGKGRSKTHNPTGRRVAITAWRIKPTS